jgi:hypothetical protein
VNFPSPAVFGREPVVVTRDRNYSAHDMEQFLAAVGLGEAVEPFRRRAIPKMDNFLAPMVPMTCINGVGTRTPLQLVYWDDDFDASLETAAYGDGDGKINLISVLAFDKEMGRQPGQRKQFKSIKISKTQHSTIVTDDFVLDRVIRTTIQMILQDDAFFRCLFINGGGHKIHPSRLMIVINGGGHFLFFEAGTFARLRKSIYGGWCLKTTASKNTIFSETDVLRCPPL